MNAQQALQTKIQERFDEYRLRNPAFSLRALARKLGINPATLSRILTGKRRASKKLTEQLAEKLWLSPQEKTALMSCFQTRGSQDTTDTHSAVQLTLDQYQILSEWHHFAIRALLRTEKAKSKPEWIAKRLGISVKQVQSALNRLARLNLIERTANAKLVPTEIDYHSPDGVSNSSIRKNHAQHLELALKSLERDPVDLRDFTNITMAIDPEKIEDARKIIRRFRKQIVKVLTSTQQKEVYSLCVQLFPLSVKENDK